MIDFSNQFEIIRPYYDNEVPAAIERVLAQPEFCEVVKYLYPQKSFDEVVRALRSVQTVEQFQVMFSGYAVTEIINRTSDGVEICGLDDLDKNSSYLFVANHRDIVLDSAIMQLKLHENGHRTSQITFGNNLMSSDLIVDIGKLNKMFTFYRGGSKIQIYKNALLHSAYIRHVLTERNESVWIAQRSGRTKDGDDRTQSSLIKMFVAGQKNFLSAIKQLKVVPVCISYEFEPCDVQKVVERCISMQQEYHKSATEDFESILSGIMNYKGGIYLSFGSPINDFIDTLDEQITLNDFADSVCSEIDRQIYSQFKLWKNNFVAYDLFTQNQKFMHEKYEAADVERFINYMHKQLSCVSTNKVQHEELFLKMYAMPVVNKLKMACKL